MPTIPSAKAKIDTTGVDPKEVAAIEKSLKAKEQAPTVAEQTGSFVDWQAVRDQLGQPFDAERIPLRRRRQMRRDPMLAFGLHYRKTPLVRAQFHVDAKDKNGPNAQIAGFMDSAWRQIHARYVFQHTLDFDFGWQSLVKRFVLGNPGGVYFDPLETNPDNALKPVWDQGNVDPVIWKPFTPVAPEQVQPKFTSDGEFDGFVYELPAGAVTSGGGGGNTNRSRTVDVYHALWATNDKDSVFGSIWGYPLIAHAFRYWWSYWFLWANLDRAFERMAVPPMVAYHPEGVFTDTETNETRPYWEIALDAAESLRSNSIAAVPSTLATSGMEDRGTQQREWAFEFIDTPTNNFDALAVHLGYLDVMKLRSIWVPEQAFIEGSGGTSSRNVAAQMGEIFLESQANKWEEIADHINRYIFPQLLAVNFPEFVNNGGTARIIGHGFAKEDTEFLKQIIQLVGQADPTALGVDVRSALERVGAPLLSPQALKQQQDKIIAASAASGPPQVTPTNGQVGTVPNPGFTNGGSAAQNPAAGPAAGGGSVTGFSDQPYVYINPNPVIELSEHDDFLAALPPTSHYSDKVMRALAVQLRRTWLSAMREMYPDFAAHVDSQTIKLDDEEDEPDVELADNQRQKAERIARRIVNNWTATTKKFEVAAQRTATILERMVKRAARIGGKRGELDKETYSDFLDRNIGRLVKSVEKTTKENLQTFLVNEIMEGKGAGEIAINIREHFDDFPDWRADRIARSETRDAFNAGTLIAAKEEGLRYVRAKDAQKGPTDELCEARDGKLYTIREAWNQMPKTHPNDTLEFEPIARASFSIENVRTLPEEAPEGSLAWFDASTHTAYVPLSLSQDDADIFLNAVVNEVMA